MIKKITLKVPANLDFELLLQKYPPLDKYDGISADRLAWHCDNLISVELKYRDDKVNKNGYVPLHSQILHDKNYNYRDCLDYLIDTGVFVCDEIYYRGIKSKGYKFSEPYSGTGFKDYVVQEFQTRRRIRVIEAELNKEATKSCKHVRHLEKYFNPEFLKINSAAAYQWIETRRMEEIVLLENTVRSNSKKYKRKKKINHRYDLYRLMVEKFDAGNFNFTQDAKSFRFHSSLTGIKRELRNFITYDGKKLVSLDVKNSQPWLTLLLFKESFYKMGRIKSEFTLNIIYPELFESLNIQDVKLLKAISKSSDKLKSTVTDFGKYRDAVLAGRIYETLIDLMRLEYPSKNISRDSMKKQLLAVFYSDATLWKTKRMPIVQVFQKHFPSVYGVFNLFKRRSYNDFAVLMQRVESKLIIKGISKRFNREYPDAPIFTVHDCLITTEEYIDKLEEITINEMIRVCNEQPRLDRKVLQMDNTENKQHVTAEYTIMKADDSRSIAA